MSRPKRYEIFGQMDSDKFMEFIIDLFDNMGMREDIDGTSTLPIECTHCPLYKECQEFEDDETTCLEFLLTKLK